MRELAFALEYDPGQNAVADALAAHQDAWIRSLSVHVTDDRLWRVDHARGDADALDAIETAFQDADYYADCLATDDCGATQTTEVLDRSAETLVLSSTWERSPVCVSVPHLARDHLGEGLLFDTRHERRHYTWRIIHSGDGDVGAFFDALDGVLGDGVAMEMLRTGATEGRSGVDLPPEQAAAVRAAVEHGYYETPRAVDVGDLADHLEVPRSTLTYRLRRAEAHLATRFVESAGQGRPD